MRALFLLLLPLTACSASQAVSPVKPPRPAPEPAPVVKAPEPEPPPEPLPFERVKFEQKLTAAPARLDTIEVRLLPEAELAKALPAALRGTYLSVDKSYEAYRKLAASAHKSAAHRAASTRARKSFRTTLARSLKTLRTRLEQKPTGALGIAVARLELWDAAGTRPSFSRDASYGAVDESTASKQAIAPLRAAVAATTLDEAIGRWARLELVHHLMATADAPSARSSLAELLPGSASDLRAQLLFRLAILDSLANDHAGAAQGFRSAHADLAVTSGVSRIALIRGELIANQRLQKFDAVLALAKEVFTEADSPTPLKPDPNPPPPPRPRSKQARTSSASATGLLAMIGTGELSMLGALSYSPRHRTFHDSDALQLATDAVERLGLDPQTLDGPERLRAGILSRLATRAHYRGDAQAAKAHATQAAALAEDESIDALRVLRVMAKSAGEDDRVAELDREITRLRYRGGEGEGVEHEFVNAEIAGKRSPSETDPKGGPPAAERSVRSLLRLCLEPVRYQLPDEKDEVLLSEITLAAKVHPGGKVELDGPSFAWGRIQADHVETCLKSLAPKLLARAPSSVRVSVAVKTTKQPRGLFELGTIGGLGVRERGIGSGLGGIGGIGVLGSSEGEREGLGAIGRGSGGGGLGGLGTRGSGSTKPSAKPKPKPKPKSPPKPSSQP